MKLSDHQRKLLRDFLTFFASVAPGCLVAFMSISPTISAYRFVVQMKMETWADMAGHYQAKVFFDEGRYRLLELHPIIKIDAENFGSKFTGKSEGPFEIWTRPFTMLRILISFGRGLIKLTAIKNLWSHLIKQ